MQKSRLTHATEAIALAMLFQFRETKADIMTSLPNVKDVPRLWPARLPAQQES